MPSKLQRHLPPIAKIKVFSDFKVALFKYKKMYLIINKINIKFNGQYWFQLLKEKFNGYFKFLTKDWTFVALVEAVIS